MANEETALTEWSGTKNSPKGPQPPRLSLREAVEIVTAIYERAGGEASPDALSEILGNTRKSSGYALKLSALKKYDLIVLDDEKTMLSDTAQSIVAPRDVAQRMQALKSSFLRIEAFKNIYERYVGKILPQDEFLRNTFLDYTSREYIDKWMDQFKDSANFAGLLLDRGDGKLQVREDGKPTELTEKEPEAKPAREVVPEVETPIDRVLRAAVEPPKTHFQFLIEILNADMTDEEQKAVWTLLQYLKKKEAGIVPAPQPVLPKKQTPDAATSGES